MGNEPTQPRKAINRLPRRKQPTGPFSGKAVLAAAREAAGPFVTEVASAGGHHHAQCECGWHATERDTVRKAYADALEHVQESYRAGHTDHTLVAPTIERNT
jgi:hypothetical protein